MTQRFFGALLAVLLLALAACTAPSVSAPPTATPTPATTPTIPIETLAPPAPLVEITLASALDKQGVPVDPKFTFSPDQPQVTALVDVGKVSSPNAPLLITWYRLADDGTANPLFVHRVSVSSYDRAYSVAKSPGTLAEGAYRVTAVLEGQILQAEMDVRARNAPGVTPVAPSPGVAPSAGASGKTAYPANATGAQTVTPGPCPPNSIVIGLINPSVDSTANSVDLMLFETCAGQSVPGPEEKIQVRATLNVASRIYEGTSNSIPRIDPCMLGTGADLPGTRIMLEEQYFADGKWHPDPLGAQEVTLGNDTLAPRLQVGSDPPHGSRVKAGDNITVRATATEPKTGGPWQTGVHSLQVTANPGGLVGAPWTNSARLPLSCSAKTWTKELTPVTYTVPQNPPEVITLCTVADDYAGNQSSQCANFPTNDQFTLTGTHQMHSDTGAGTNVHTRINLDATFVAHSVAGDRMQGSAQVTFSQSYEFSSAGCSVAWATGDLTWRADLEGTFQRDADGTLQVALKPIEPRGPSFPIQSCPGPTSGTERPVLPGWVGTLVNGKFDQTQQDGAATITIHMQISP